MFLYVQVKKHLKKGKNLSMGFGFVEFDSVETTSNVHKDLQVKPVWSKLVAYYMQFFGNLVQLLFIFSREQFWMGTNLLCIFVMPSKINCRKKMGRVKKKS